MAPEDIFCSVQVDKVLANCQHTAVMACGQSNEGFKCVRPCEKLLCAAGHKCAKPCYLPCGDCPALVERVLPCGHRATLPCHVDPNRVVCKVPRQCDLPCGHAAQIPCGQDPHEVQCPQPCDARLDCGHRCTRHCHPRDDADHERYECRKSCGRPKKGCKTGEHACGKQCCEDCSPCNVKWNRALPCGHSAFVECYHDDADIHCTYAIFLTNTLCNTKVLDVVIFISQEFG